MRVANGSPTESDNARIAAVCGETGVKRNEIVSLCKKCVQHMRNRRF